MSIVEAFSGAARPGPVALRGHQVEALEAVVRGLTPGPGAAGPPEGLRVTVQMATGSGKSYVGAAAGRKLAPHGAVLVVVPTLDLLLQMVGSWREAGRSGEMYAVCSLEPGALPSGVRGTTNPMQVALWLARAGARRRPVTLFATYASAGAVADAYLQDSALVGEVPPLELMVCDEAHRSSGSAEKRWTVVLDQAALPARRRLFMTATPRIWAPPRYQGREEANRPLREELVCSMDSVELYGPQVFTLGLAEAVDRKLLAPFEVVVLELRAPESDPVLAARQPVPWGPGVGEDQDGEEDQVDPGRVAAIQAGLLKAAAEQGLRKVITFHHRTIEARYFSETLNQTAERLHLEDPAKYPDEVWAQWISGEHGTAFRKDVIRGFAASGETDGLPCAYLANCRVLGEGMDIVAVDAILLQGRGSMVDIVQAIGRALRPSPGKEVARLIVPVFLQPGEDPGSILESDSYAPLVKVLTALRAHDTRVVEKLAVPQLSGKRTKGRSAEAVVAPGQAAAGPGGVPSFTLPVRFQTPVDPDVLALFVNLRVLTGETQYWREGITAARRWAEETGGLEVPYSATVGEGPFPLGRWLADRRAEYAAGTLAPHRVGMLDDLGMVWSVTDARFEAGLDWARLWAKEHGGSLAAPARASIGGYAIGAFLTALRAAAGIPQGEPGALSPERHRRLEEIDPWWCPAWPITWQRTYAAARQWWLACDGRVDWPTLPADTTYEGQPLGRWIATQRATWPDLDQEQQELLMALGVQEDPGLVAAKKAAEAKPKVSRQDRFQLHLTALAEFVQREGHARVPRAHKTVEGLSLGAWLNNTKARKDKLTEKQLGQLAALGVAW
ncbi:Helicase associated domain protein [Peterkaempfera bronchialis]|uniref:DEAD/DEAH box helicase n=1 Tax=Peterkaempfera bronchialis TaxID=2126346 RepID=UPI003C2B9448